MHRTHVEKAPSTPRPEAAAAGLGHRRSPVGGTLLRLQRSHGNRHVQGVIQRSAVLGGADDRYERESDRIARLVTRLSAPGAGPAERFAAPRVTHRHPTAGDDAVDADVRHGIDRARGSGRRLPDALRGSMEQAFDADLGGVRLHTDARAHELSRSLGARAFTTGHDIFFRRGDYDPVNPGGRELLAHELTHVVQQGGGGAAQPTLQRTVIQRVLTDEARRVLDEANRRQPGFTALKLGQDTIAFLDRTSVPQALIAEIIDLPDGAPAALKEFVQAFLLRHFAASIIERANALGAASAEQRQKILKLLAEVTGDLRKTLIRAGYGQPELTPELKSTIMYHWYGMGDSTWQRYFEGANLDLGAHGVAAAGGGDPRRMEVCATFVPGGQVNALGRAHSFLLYTDGSGKMQYISAHDDGTGMLKAATGVWSVTVFDDKKLKRVVVATGQAAQDAFPTMLEAMGDINAAALEYKMTEQNCNSATHYFLSAAGLGHVAGPSKMTRRFGWSKKLQKKTNRPVPYPTATLAGPTAPPAPATVPTTTWARTASRGGQKQTLLTAGRRRVADPLGPFGAEPVETPRSRASAESSDEDQRAVSTLVEADDAFVLLTPLAMGAVEIDAGTRVEILKLSRSNDMAHIDYGRGRTGYVGLRDLEAAVGQRLG